LIESYYMQTVDEEDFWSLNSRLHDFGFRGCTSVEQSVIGGCAHLLNFDGTDTMSAAYYAQMYLNFGVPIGTSVPATEHSVMTSWRSEQEAISNMIFKFGEGVFACVMDSYDYANALNNVLPSVAQQKIAKGGVLVVRPDSGDQVETVLMALRALEKIFGVKVNKKGYKVIQGAGVIQGDGVTYKSLKDMLKAVKDHGYASQCVTFGMGGGLLQKLNRDTMSFATKLSYIRYADGSEKDVIKVPQTDKSKYSLPGKLSVVSNEKKLPVVYPASSKPAGKVDKLELVYNGTSPTHRFYKWESLDVIRNRVETEWKARLPKWDPISPELAEKCKKVMDLERDRISEGNN